MNDCHSYVHNFKYLWKWGVQWLLRPSLHYGVNNDVMNDCCDYVHNLRICEIEQWLLRLSLDRLTLYRLPLFQHDKSLKQIACGVVVCTAM